MHRLILYICLLACPIGLAGAGTPHQGEPTRPVPVPQGLDPERVALGKALFFDRRLSGDGSTSCADCHRMELGGTDAEVPSRGVGGALGKIKTPSVFNSKFNIAQFWDGRALDLSSQLDGPIHNPLEMNSNWPDIIRRLRADRSFRDRFVRSYPQGIEEETLKHALVTFEESLTTLDAPFDRWLEGDDAALSKDQFEGYRLFKSYGCVACHQGVNVGGNLFQRMGVMGDYFKDRGTSETQADQGRFNVTGDPADRHYFKVPSLRTVSLQRRFFHDGSATSLDDAIQVMGRYQLGREIPPDQRKRIADFLGSLLGRHPLLVTD